MARTKRKVNPLRPQPTAAPQAKEFQTAAYIRLSIEDSGKPGSDTIEGQKDLILAYIERQADLRLVEVYCDNGHTGTNFDRPDFERMMEDVRRGKVNCIVVKDLSRFGRNYHETSNYLLRIFPFLGVRFVAVNDNFDTETAVETEYGLVMPLKNIINDTYSRDISRKISSAIETKERRGEFVGVYAPFGYRKSDGDRHKLVPNPETAPIIREIFVLRLQGLGYTGIARLLNGREVPSPGAYLYQCGLSKQEKYRDAIWAAWNIKEILRDEVYLGHLVQGKRTNVAYKQARKERNAPADEWRVFRNAHEPLIDEETFAAAQRITAENRQVYEERLGKADDRKTPSLFHGLVFCGDCGKALVRRHIYNRRQDGRIYYYNYLCVTSVKKANACTPKNLKETKLAEVVESTIRCHLDAVAELEQRCLQVWDEKTAVRRISIERQMAEEERRLSRNMALLEGLYAQLVDGVIDRDEYLSMKEHYQAEYLKAKERYDVLNGEAQNLLHCGPANPMFEACRPFYQVESLTEDLIQALVAKITVYDGSRLDVQLVYQDEFLRVASFLEGVTGE